MGTSIPEVADAMSELLGPTADRLARACGAVQRARRLPGGPFARTLVLGWMNKPDATLVELAQAAADNGVPVTPQAIAQRFTGEAAGFLLALLNEAVHQAIVADPVVAPILDRFPGVFILDGTTINLPDVLRSVWAGCGEKRENAKRAALKAQTRIDLRTGQLVGLDITDGKASDNTSAQQMAPVPPGALRIADLGYFGQDRLASIDAAGGYFLTRFQSGTATYDESGERLYLPRELNRLRLKAGEVAELTVQVGQRAQVVCRLVVERVPPQVVGARRRALRRNARKHSRTPNPEALELAAFTIIVTNAPASLLSAREALTLLHVRWQIELLFKLWKSIQKVDESRSRNPWRQLCEVYAKLIACVVEHWILLVGCWDDPWRSAMKATKVIQNRALTLAMSFREPGRLVEALRGIVNAMHTGCRIDKRGKRPATIQRLLQFGELPS